MNRDRYIERLKADLDRWNAQVDAWEARLREAQGRLHWEYEAQLNAWRSQRDVAAQKLRGIQATTSAAWEEMARGADQAWGDLAAAFEHARSRFEEPAPQRKKACGE